MKKKIFFGELMLYPCLIDGKEIPLGHDDVREFLEQYGEVDVRFNTSRTDDGIHLLPLVTSVGGFSRCVGIVAAYPGKRWVIFATREGRARKPFEDLMDAIEYAFPKVPI